MTGKFVAACVQNCAGADLERNLDDAVALTRDARRAGADFICLAEFFACLDVDDAGLHVGAHAEAEHPALSRFRALARELGAWILLGSLAVRVGANRTRNRSLLIDADGEVVARYDKIHMFDVDLAKGESYRESDLFEAGAAAVTAQLPWGVLGLSVCYDLRFAYLYRSLAQAGASFITIPAAFTKTTGEAHWHVLVRSRAIETGCYVFAPCQHGRHGRARTYGHSLIVDPWGEVLADGGEDRGFVVAEVDPAAVRTARRRIPALEHDRRFTPAAAAACTQAAAGER